MRKINCGSLVVISILLITSVANATGIRNEYKDFEIILVDDLYLGKKVEAVWTLNYDNAENSVTVIKRKTVEGTEYVVGAEYFAVRYLATNKGFGAKTVKKAWSKVDSRINQAVLNQQQLENQEIITPNKVDDKMALGLIANYLPDLINDGYTHLLN